MLGSFYKVFGLRLLINFGSFSKRTDNTVHSCSWTPCKANAVEMWLCFQFCGTLGGLIGISAELLKNHSAAVFSGFFAKSIWRGEK